MSMGAGPSLGGILSLQEMRGYFDGDNDPYAPPNQCCALSSDGGSCCSDGSSCCSDGGTGGNGMARDTTYGTYRPLPGFRVASGRNDGLRSPLDPGVTASCTDGGGPPPQDGPYVIAVNVSQMTHDAVGGMLVICSETGYGQPSDCLHPPTFNVPAGTIHFVAQGGYATNCSTHLVHQYTGGANSTTVPPGNQLVVVIVSQIN